jgi:hypothetical protein
MEENKMEKSWVIKTSYGFCKSIHQGLPMCTSDVLNAYRFSSEENASGMAEKMSERGIDALVGELSVGYTLAFIKKFSA